MAINVADILHAATQQGILGKANQIYDDALGKDQATLNQEFASIVIPKPEKEVVPVLTAATTAPESPSADDLYINTFDNKLYKYSGSAWVEETQSRDVVYITDDTSHLYLWNGTEFTDVTGQEVDGVIYYNQLSDLDPYVTPGVYTAAYIWPEYNWVEYMTLVVNSGDDYISQELSDRYKFSWRNKHDSQAWTEWMVREYAFRQDLDIKADKPKLADPTTSGNVITLRIGKIYDLTDTPLTAFDTINLSDFGAIAGECPQWHFFFECGATMPSIIGNIPGIGDIEPVWDNAPDWAEEDLVEVDVVKVGGNYYGLWNVKDLS